MRKLLVLALALVAVALAGSPATAAAQPTITMEEDCTAPSGVAITLSGFPPNRSTRVVIEPSCSVLVTRRVRCSHETRRPCRSRA